MKISEDKVFRFVPIIVIKIEIGYNAAIADNYKNYKQSIFKDINFEDLAFHFGIVEHYKFNSKKEAKFEAQYVKENLKECGIKSKVWVL